LVVARQENWQKLLQYISKEFNGKFKISQHGKCTSFNGIEIISSSDNPRKISINQNVHARLTIQKLVDKYALSGMTPKDSLPIYTHHKNVSDKDKMLCGEKEISEYQSIVGNLIWIAINTRPDLMHFATSASRASKTPNKLQLQIVRQSIGYLINNPNMSINYDGVGINEVRLEAYSDSDLAAINVFTQFIPSDNPASRRSTTGYVITLGSGAIAYKSMSAGLLRIRRPDHSLLSLLNVITKIFCAS